MFKHFYLTLSAIALIGVSITALASDLTSDLTSDPTSNLTSDAPVKNTPDMIGEKLEAEAEKILQSEPGAEEVTVRIEIAPTESTSHRQIVNFDEFDINSDGILDQAEIGHKLFLMFDRDGNEVIDNIEMKTPNIIVFSDMEKTKTETIRYNDPHKPAKQVVTHEEFMQASKLARFDKDKDGLSPLDFLGKTFYQVDVDKDGVINRYEWERAYAETLRPRHEERFNYND